MFKLLLTLLIIWFEIVYADHHLISAGCDDNKTCLQFIDCGITTLPTSANLATIYTTDNDTVEFQLQYNDSGAGWIAIGLSNTSDMLDSYIFMCVRPDASSVRIEERFATDRIRPNIETSILTTVSTANVDSLLNCTFTSPVTRTPMLNNATGYFVLLAWGPYNSNDIQQHSTSGMCVSSARVVVTTATGATQPTTQTTQVTTQAPQETTQTTQATTQAPQETTQTTQATTQAQTTQAGGRCTGENTCFSFPSCSTTNSPTTNFASIYTTDTNTVEFQIQYDNTTAGWIAIGLSETKSMANSYIFMCTFPDASNVMVQERLATGRSRPEIATSLLTTVSTTNVGSILNCTFTSPVTRTPMLNYAAGYYVLLAWGQYTSNDIQQHSDRCVTSDRVRVTTVVGSGTVQPIAIPCFLLLILLIPLFLA